MLLTLDQPRNFLIQSHNTSLIVALASNLSSNRTHMYFSNIILLFSSTLLLTHALQAEVNVNPSTRTYYYLDVESEPSPLLQPILTPTSIPNPNPSTTKTFLSESTDTFASYASRQRHARRLETGLPTLGDEDYLFRDTREFLCQGVNEVRSHYKTIQYTNPSTGAGDQREYCATNGTELKSTIEQGPNEIFVVLPRGKVIHLNEVGSILIRQGQTVHLRANNGTTSIDGGNSTRMFVVHGNLIVDTVVFINGNSNTGRSSWTWTEPSIEMPSTRSGGAVHLTGGRSSATFVDCTWYNNNPLTTAPGRDIWNEGELLINHNNFGPSWNDAPQPIRNDGVIKVTPEGSWNEMPFDGIQFQ